MRYIKVFLLIFVFFLVMMFFVQNQASFADPVVLKMDTFFWGPIESYPTPMYALMLLAFATGAFLVLLMLMWDRMSLSSAASTARRKAASMEKRVARVMEEATKIQEDAKNHEAQLRDEFSKKEAKLKEEAAAREAKLIEEAAAREAKLHASLEDALHNTQN